DPGGLHAAIAVQRGALALDVELQLPARGVTALFGPSAAGKTTLLRCIAGLERAPRARIALGDEVWQDTQRGLFVLPHRREVGYVFQGAELFPHLTVRGNLEFAARRAGRRAVAWDEVVTWLGLEPLLPRTTASLSGG